MLTVLQFSASAPVSAASVGLEIGTGHGAREEFSKAFRHFDSLPDERLHDFAKFRRMRGRDQHPARRPRARTGACVHGLRPRWRYAGTRFSRTGGNRSAMRARICSSLTLSARTAPRTESMSGNSARRRSMLLGEPTSMADASVGMLARGCHSPLCRKSGTARLALCASTMRPIGRPILRAQTQATELPRLPLGMTKFGADAVRAMHREAGGGVVHRLRQQAPEIDAVRARQFEALPRARRRRTLPSPGAGSRRSVPLDAVGVHVVAPAGELALLRGRNQALGEQHRNDDAGPAMERRGHRAAGVAGGRDQDVERPRGAGSRMRCSEAARKRAPKSLNAAVGSVEQLEHRQLAAVGHRHERRGKIERVAHDAADLAARSGRPRRTAAT